MTPFLLLLREFFHVCIYLSHPGIYTRPASVLSLSPLVRDREGDGRETGKETGRQGGTGGGGREGWMDVKHEMGVCMYVGGNLFFSRGTSLMK